LRKVQVTERRLATYIGGGRLQPQGRHDRGGGRTGSKIGGKGVEAISSRRNIPGKKQNKKR